ncbi:Reverse transcriptase domain-containing protein, partial [Aphis craccivora]
TADIIKVNLHKNDIVSNYRLKKIDKSDGKIIVKFNSKTIKESFLNGVKSLAISKQPLKSNQIHNSFPDKIVYVNHELSPMFRKIFWLTKQLSKEYNWKYVWANSNGVYLRKTDGDVPIKIQSIKDISGYDVENNIFSMNIRSINCNFDELVLMLSSMDDSFDILILSETWLLVDFNFVLNGYYNINSLGHINKSDGVTIFSITHGIITECNSIELVFDHNGKTLSIIGIYRSPNSNKDNFVIGLNDYLQRLNDSNVYYIIAGDININIIDPDISFDYLNTMATHNFISCINECTRITNHSSSCLDHIFTKNINSENIQAFIPKCKITDHFGTIVLVENYVNNINDCHTSQNKTRTKINIKLLNLLISSQNWNDIIDRNNIDKSFQHFLNKIEEMINMSSFNHVFKMSNKYKRIKDWITKGLIISTNHKHKLSKQLFRHPFDSNLKQKCNNYINILNTLIRYRKKIYYQDLLSKLQNNPKKMWEKINNITGRAKTYNMEINSIRLNNNSIANGNINIANEFNTMLTMTFNGI